MAGEQGQPNQREFRGFMERAMGIELHPTILKTHRMKALPTLQKSIGDNWCQAKTFASSIDLALLHTLQIT
jgi:hypothetical protein